MRKFTLLTVVLLCIASCESKKDDSVTATPGGASASSTHKKITIALLPKRKGIPYFSTCDKGAEECAKELGDEVIYDGPTDGSPEQAASMIEKWTLQGVDVIAVSPNDPEVLKSAMAKAREKGVHVITWDSDGAPGTREFFVNQATAKDIGYALADTLAKDIGGGDAKNASGEVAIVTATLTATNQNEWMKYIKERLPEYPNLKLVEVKPCNDDSKLAFQVSQDLIKAYPNLKGIFAISSVAFPGAADAIKQSGKAGQIQVTGLSTPNDMKSFVLDGTVKSVILWNTVDLGYLTVQTADALANGTLKSGDTTLKAGRLGDRKVVGDNVMLGDILVFTKDNIEKFDF